ncbi:MAG: succinate dehydrogenase [Rhodospirillaceae bacterium]|jgi:fumarate reductase subunit D|nr:succinate dehydrogenase [Rhodospirillaceae bacterium]|tara:strand:+ start:285 stop:632 length:348 start_codon:yes stop_codon:yes gene_type:complete
MKLRYMRRDHPTWWAFAVHRLSGVAMALFLPVHFYVLALAIEGEARLESFLAWSLQPWVKVAEAGLIFLLAAHLTGGMRLLALEFLPWRDWQKTLVAVSGGLSFGAGLLFLVNAF